MKNVVHVRHLTDRARAERAKPVAQLAALCAAEEKESYVLEVGDSTFITFDAATHADLVRQFTK